MPRYEKKDSKGIAFWAFHLLGRPAFAEDGRLLLRDGRAGQNGAENLLDLKTRALAQAEADRRAAAHVKKGFALCSSLPRERSAPEVHGLEAAIAKTPDDREPYVVYADWLQERGDDLGELITLALAREDAAAAKDTKTAKRLEKTIDQWSQDHFTTLFGPVAKHIKRLQLVWQRGLIESVRIRTGPAEKGITSGDLIAALLSLPVGRFVTKLTFPSFAYTDAMLAFADVVPLALRDLTVEAAYEPVPLALSHLNVLEGLRVLDLRVTDIKPKGLALPNLETLRLTNMTSLDGTTMLPSVTRFELCTLAWFRPAAFDRLHTQCPNLQTVAILEGGVGMMHVEDVVEHISNELPNVTRVEVKEIDVERLRGAHKTRKLRRDLEIAAIGTKTRLTSP